MILQALVQYYEDLLANDKITRPGWTSAKVSWALELDENGQLMALHPLHQEEKRGKKPALVPLQMKVPEQVKRSRNIISNFMCENSAYMLGIGKKEKKEHALQCFAAAKELHLTILQNVPGQAVNSTPFVRQYDILFNKWGVLLCQKEYQTNDIRRNSREWL